MESLSLHPREGCRKTQPRVMLKTSRTVRSRKCHLTCTPNVEDQTKVVTVGPQVALDMHIERSQFAKMGGTLEHSFSLICSQHCVVLIFASHYDANQEATFCVQDHGQGPISPTQALAITPRCSTAPSTMRPLHGE